MLDQAMLRQAQAAAGQAKCTAAVCRDGTRRAACGGGRREAGGGGAHNTASAVQVSTEMGGLSSARLSTRSGWSAANLMAIYTHAAAKPREGSGGRTCGSEWHTNVYYICYRSLS